MPHLKNLLLASLSPADMAMLQPHLNPVVLEQKAVLYESRDEIDLVYFPTTAVISLVIGLSTGEMIESAMVGRDGVIGATAALDGKVSLSRAVVQISGTASTCRIDSVKDAALKSPTLLASLIRHEQTVYAQAQQSTACIAVHEVEPRLCRWLLRARDLSESDTLPFTQEILGQMLGVRRTSVTAAAHALQKAGLIKYSRGKIQINDGPALERAACECYFVVKEFYRNLIGPEPLAAVTTPLLDNQSRAPSE